MVEKFTYGLLGTIMGAAAGAAGTWYFMDAVNIPITAGAAVVCGISVAIGGETAIKAIWDVVEEVID